MPAPASAIPFSNYTSLFLPPLIEDSDSELYHRYAHSTHHLSHLDAFQFYCHSSFSPFTTPSSCIESIDIDATHYQSSTDCSSSFAADNPIDAGVVAIPCKSRSLTTAITITAERALAHGDEDMATTVAPSSPPDLSSSKSSTKSSSLESSPFAADETNDPSHFEDISLAADTPPAKPPVKTDVKSRPLVRPSLTPLSPQANLSSPNLSDDIKASASRTKHAGGVQSPSSLRMNFQRVRSSPSLASPSFGNTSRTPSPNKSSPFPQPSRSPNRFPPRLNSYESSPSSPSRRLSWQNVKRKTAEELEKEYDDSDEDLPEDAVVWNIPLTPRPMHSRSHSNSPERPSAKSPSTNKKSKPPRSKSWTDAMGDLSAEVKALTAALESHADLSVEEGRSQSTESAVRPSLKNHHAKSMNLPIQRGHAMIDPLPVSKEKEKYLTRTRPSWLPPKCPKEERKHLREWEHMMSSFLAAEKRRAASETKAKASLEKLTLSAAQEWETNILPNWDAAIRSPNTREMWWSGIPASVRGQVWTKAIGNELQLSHSSYYAALKRASAIEDRISMHNKENQPQKVEELPTVRGRPEGDASKQDARMGRSLRALDADISTTFPTLTLFQEHNSLHESLRNILKAYAAYRSDTGYIRGTSGVAALLLLHLSPQHTESKPPSESETAEVNTNESELGKPTAEDGDHHPDEEAEAKAFIALSNLLNKQPTLSFCLSDENAKHRFASHIRSVLRQKMPRLAEHFLRLGLHVDDWLSPMVLSLFTSILGPTEASRVWDVLVFEGDVAIVRAVVGILTFLESGLYGSSVTEVIEVLGWRGWVARKGEGVALIGAEKAGEEAAQALMGAVRQAGRRDAAEGHRSRPMAVAPPP